MTKQRKTEPKVEESAAAYKARPTERAKKHASANMQITDEAEIQRITDRIFAERKELFRRLAQ